MKIRIFDMNKIVIIDNCSACPHFNDEYYDYMEECEALGRKIPDRVIPDDCPLATTEDPVPEI